MSDPHLDASTLRWVADAAKTLGETILSTPFPGMSLEGARGAWMALDNLATQLRQGAARKDREPPVLSEFVRACEVSDLGMPAEWMHGDNTGRLIAFWPDHDVSVSMFVEAPGGIIHGATVTHDGIRDDQFVTPAALTEALNAIAKDLR